MKSVFFLCLTLHGTILAAAPHFTESLISKDFTYPYGISVADLNGDGRLDITVADARKANSLYWFENIGSERFARHLIHHQPPPAWRLERHVIADVNRDGLPDIVIVENSTGDLRWLENPGPQQVREPWTPHFITMSGKVPGAYDVDVGDLDGDGWPDVVASSWREGNMFTWHRNPGSLSGKSADYMTSAASDNMWAEWKMQKIGENLLETRNARLADIDGDGDLDVLGTASRSGLIVWLENPGYLSPLPWPLHYIDQTGRPGHGHAIDMDKDGDLDVVMASGFVADIVPSEVMPVVGRIAWYENIDHGARWKRHVVQESLPAFEAFARDLDMDGDVDIVATAKDLSWYENLGNDKWVRHVLKKEWPSAAQVIVADLDGDGRPDIVACAESGPFELRWWRNEGGESMIAAPKSP